jgi:hypothetical protein
MVERGITLAAALQLVVKGGQHGTQRYLVFEAYSLTEGIR